eukprot:5135714-Pleurochrysis_carterae.AAC.1
MPAEPNHSSTLPLMRDAHDRWSERAASPPRVPSEASRCVAHRAQRAHRAIDAPRDRVEVLHR